MPTIHFGEDADYVVYGRHGSPSFSVFMIPGSQFEGSEDRESFGDDE
ncbi:hypothetical protein [Rhodopseudomonas palustris]|nr:hypothetical protein [Rhodopseudomonas palustris]